MAIYTLTQNRPQAPVGKARVPGGLSTIQETILKALKEWGDGLSTSDISELTGLKKDTVSPRMPDLRAMGLIDKVEKGKGIMVWVVR